MIYWDKYKEHVSNVLGTRKFFDNTIYTFDIETSSYFILDGIIHNPNDYLKLSEKDKKRCIKRGHMYIWMFSINEDVYYGRTWDELKEFLKRVNDCVGDLKYVFIHNLAFEFQFLKSNFHFDEVFARKSHKIIYGLFRDFKFELRCSYTMTNVKLSFLPEMFNLSVNKKEGQLDYNKIRNPNTELTSDELEYCEYDCLVLYYYIKEELKVYETVKNIPKTATGKVRRELYNLVIADIRYKNRIRKSVNTNPVIYNRLCESFIGGYTHSNWIFTDEVIENVDSYDISSSYPFVLCTEKYPSNEFKPCKIRRREDMSDRFCYLLVVKFKNVSCKYYNTFISSSKCRNIKGAKYDNGRIISAKEFEMTLTSVDFYFYLDTYNLEYEILECYYSTLAYLPKVIIEFILNKYVGKTALKNVEGREVEYSRIKANYNAIYGMSVTNNISDKVIYDDSTGLWSEVELTNDEIIEKLLKEKKKGFMSFATGVFCTSYARDNLLRRVIENDSYVIYCDTDSCKLREGYNKDVFIKYNERVKNKIKRVAKLLKINEDKFHPKDINGIEHMMGLFEFECFKEKKDKKHTYSKFITQGAKKYAYTVDDEIHITVSGVPKSASKYLKSLDDFRDDYVFQFDEGEKNLLFYVENQEPLEVTDYKGDSYKITDKSACCILPTTYELSKSLDYADLINDKSSKRAKFKEELL